MMPRQDFIPAGVQEELDARVTAGGGNVDTIRNELQNELQALEKEQNESGNPQASRDRLH